MNKECMHCHWWAMRERTEAAAYLESECHKRAPHPDPKGRSFPVTKGEDGCGDYIGAGPEIYREDYREKLGPWWKVTML